MKSLIVIGISFLFITTSVSSSGINKDENFNDISTEITDIKLKDNNWEIITYIAGWFDPLKVIFEGDFYLEIWEEEGFSIMGVKYILYPLICGIFLKPANML